MALLLGKKLADTERHRHMEHNETLFLVVFPMRAVPVSQKVPQHSQLPTVDRTADPETHKLRSEVLS